MKPTKINVNLEASNNNILQHNISSVHTFIDGLSSFKSMSTVYTIPRVVIDLIILYSTPNGLDLHSHLFILQQDKTMKLYNMMTKQITNIHINYTNRNNLIYNNRLENAGYVQINKVTLPFAISNKLQYQYTNITKSDSISSNKWSFHAQIGGYDKVRGYRTKHCNLTAFHPSLCLYGQSYNFELPSFPERIADPSLIYNHRNNKLFAMNCKSGTAINRNNHIVLKNADKIYTLNWYHIHNDREEWKWNINGCRLNRKRWNTSLCTVDNDKYIGIIGGYIYDDYIKTVELYSVEDNRAILLKDMCLSRNNAVSYYDDKYNHLIVGSDNSMEWYDFHKQNWCVLTQKIFIEEGEMKKMWQSINPNILFVAQLNDYGEIDVVQFDLRRKQQSIINHNANIPNIADYFHIFV